MDLLTSIATYVIPFLVILSVVVFVHELGHYLIARRNGVRVDVFSIGFGPELFGFNDRAGTRWKFSVLPLGGYVKMHGDADPDQLDDRSERPPRPRQLPGQVRLAADGDRGRRAARQLRLRDRGARPALRDRRAAGDASRGRRGPGGQRRGGGRSGAGRSDRGGRRRRRWRASRTSRRSCATARAWPLTFTIERAGETMDLHGHAAPDGAHRPLRPGPSDRPDRRQSLRHRVPALESAASPWSRAAARRFG